MKYGVEINNNKSLLNSFTPEGISGWTVYHLMTQGKYEKLKQLQESARARNNALNNLEKITIKQIYK